MNENNVAIRGEIVISDPDGSNEQVFPMNSILRNFMRFIARRLNSYGSEVLWTLWAPIASNGESQMLNDEWYNYILMVPLQYYMANPAVWNNALILGTGQADKSFEMIAMDSPITPTTHPDVQFFIPRLTYIPYSTNRDCRSANISRLFVNNSNEDIHVQEMSLSIARDLSNTPGKYLMLIYDHVDMVIPANSGKNFCIKLYFENYMLDNFAYLIASRIGCRGNQTVRNIENQLAQCIPSTSTTLTTGVSTSTPYGIFVGRGDTPVTPEDYILADQIPHGSGDGQIIRIPNQTSSGAPTPMELMTTVNGNLTFRIMWNFRNDSVSNVTIREIGVYAWIGGPVMVYRKVLEAPVIMYPGDMYKFEILFSGIYE